MNTLAEYQKSMLALIKGRPMPPLPQRDRHMAELEQSRGLELLREIAVWWRGFAVESTCPWTARLLKRLGSFEAAITEFYREQNVSPYVARAGEQFLFQMSAHPEPLVHAMARLELALMRVKQGSADEYLVQWDRNPELIFQALRSGSDMPSIETGVCYETYISRDIPGLVRCDCIEREFTAKT
jgi:hypothetical protein